MTDQQISKRIILAGGSGFLGTNLAHTLVDAGYEVIILSRGAPKQGRWTTLNWDGQSIGDWAGAVDGAHAVVNFSGRSIDCLLTPENKKQVIDSRIDSTRVLGLSIERAAVKPSVWVQLSAVGIYGNKTGPLDETAEIGTGFLAEVCSQWEAAFRESCPDDVRQVVVRAGVVLGHDEAAFPKLAKIAKLGFGGAAGNGKQGMSWIHEDDMDGILRHAIEDESMQGIYNGTAPNPASNKEFMRTLRRVVKMPFGPPAPAFMVRIGAKFVLKTNPDLALEGQYAHPKNLMDSGYPFEYPELQNALTDLYQKMKNSK
ncbi:MAG: TIGR01777 family oxidoreductase [Phycisphaerales bacterium]